ncbi:hypothetical protein PLICRDRAFT_173291 [Plicaturopsis crispa FD-325 SS-3]|nr:hypothetical protein PLICRDRAFT_173291 [Plicaturopsis crispa FD-325 SS-3]
MPADARKRPTPARSSSRPTPSRSHMRAQRVLHASTCQCPSPCTSHPHASAHHDGRALLTPAH